MERQIEGKSEQRLSDLLLRRASYTTSTGNRMERLWGRKDCGALSTTTYRNSAMPHRNMLFLRSNLIDLI